jgi:glycosyltransferase involved in cell wall biosynthesis
LRRILCVFPNDPIHRYYKKGEIKPRYFNPCDYFEEVHAITFDDWDVKAEMVQEVAGKGKLFIYPVGKPSYLRIPIFLKNVFVLIERIKPSVVRAYNPHIQGLFAVLIGKKFKIPSVVSLHANYDKDYRELIKLGVSKSDFKSLIRFFIVGRLIEEYVIRNADQIIAAYRFPAIYAKQHGARKVKIIYNRVDMERFKRRVDFDFKKDRLQIICVGRLDREKNQQCLIKAVARLNVNLLIVGDGEQRVYLQNLTRKLGIQNRVRFIQSIPNSEIHKLYWESDIFAIPIEYGGVCIPVIEAMASSLPVVLPKPRWEEKPELAGDVAIVVENTPKGFEEGLRSLIENPEMRKELGERGRKIVEKIDGRIMEQEEKDVYAKLVERGK